MMEPADWGISGYSALGLSDGGGIIDERIPILASSLPVTYD